MKKATYIFALTLLLGAVLWNGWVLGFVNHGTAGYLHMSISELEANGQAHVGLFNFLEDASGVLMIIGGLGLFISIGRKATLPIALLLACIVAIGGLTLYDVAHPLDCDRYNNPICTTRVNDNDVSHTDVLHNDESRITAYVTIALGVVTVVWTFIEKQQRSTILFLAIMTIGVVVTLLLLDVSNDVLAGAIAERIWNVLVSINIGFIAWHYAKKPNLLTR